MIPMTRMKNTKGTQITGSFPITKLTRTTQVQMMMNIKITE